MPNHERLAFLALYALCTAAVLVGRLAVPGHELSLVGSLGAAGFILSGFLAGVALTGEPAADLRERLVAASLALYALSGAWTLYWMPAGPDVGHNAYESLAHVWVGFTLAPAVLWAGPWRWAALALWLAAAAFEAWMFLNRSKD
jgi:hypothetical protein